MECCPTCEKEFETERAVKIHHSKIHDESIAGVTTECEYCGEKVTAPASADRKYCSKRCVDKAKSESFSGRGHPQWVDYETTECEYCGDEFEEQTGNPNRFCSRKCQANSQSEEFSGEDWHLYGKCGKEHPTYTGHEDYYGSNWQEQRKAAIERDNRKCVACGISQKEHKVEFDCDLHVHHIQPIATFDTPEGANNLNNLITLCRKDHLKWEGIPVAPMVTQNE